MSTDPFSTPALIRPVKCHFCGAAMFYSTDPRHEPELKVRIYQSPYGSDKSEGFYAHTRCWTFRYSVMMAILNTEPSMPHKPPISTLSQRSHLQGVGSEDACQAVPPPAASSATLNPEP